MDSDQDAIEAFQKALLQAQNNPEPKDTTFFEAVERDLDGELGLSGSISPDTTISTKSNTALFTVYAENEESSNQFWGLFLTGMIGLPIITGLISMVITGAVYGYENEPFYVSNSALHSSEVTIREEIYNEYEFHLGDGFGDELEGNLGQWEISVWGLMGNQERGDGLLRGYDDEPIAVDSWLDGDGNLWYQMEILNYHGDIGWTHYYGGHCEWEGNDGRNDDTRWWCKSDTTDEGWDDWWYYCEHHDSDWHCTDGYGQYDAHENSANGTSWAESGLSNMTAYIKLDGDEVDIATKGIYAPNTVYYWSEELDYEEVEFGVLPVIIWPISLIGGIIWGYKTDKKPFAYGIMTAGLLALLLPFVAVIMIVLFFGYY